MVEVMKLTYFCLQNRNFTAYLQRRSSQTGKLCYILCFHVAKSGRAAARPAQQLPPPMGLAHTESKTCGMRVCVTDESGIQFIVYYKCTASKEKQKQQKYIRTTTVSLSLSEGRTSTVGLLRARLINRSQHYIARHQCTQLATLPSNLRYSTFT